VYATRGLTLLDDGTPETTRAEEELDGLERASDAQRARVGLPPRDAIEDDVDDDDADDDLDLEDDEWD